MSSRRLFSATAQRSNLVSDLYVQQIKQFKPTPVTGDLDSVKKFQMPAKPQVPSDEVSADAVSAYEASEVETEVKTAAGQAAPEEDWFVFEDDEEHH